MWTSAGCSAPGGRRSRASARRPSRGASGCRKRPSACGRTGGGGSTSPTSSPWTAASAPMAPSSTWRSPSARPAACRPGTGGPTTRRARAAPAGRGCARRKAAAGSTRCCLWGVFAFDCSSECDDRGVIVTSPVSMPNPPAWVHLREPGWVDFGRGEVPVALGIPTFTALSAARLARGGHSPAGLVAPEVVERFTRDRAFARAVLRFFGTRPELVRDVFSTAEAPRSVVDLTASPAGPEPPGRAAPGAVAPDAAGGPGAEPGRRGPARDRAAAIRPGQRRSGRRRGAGRDPDGPPPAVEARPRLPGRRTVRRRAGGGERRAVAVRLRVPAVLDRPGLVHRRVARGRRPRARPDPAGHRVQAAVPPGGDDGDLPPADGGRPDVRRVVPRAVDGDRRDGPAPRGAST